MYRQFPWKLHEMLREQEEGVHNGSDPNDDGVVRDPSIVSWLDHGKAFRVHKPHEFVTTIMPQYFRQTHYKSFQRQLNLWGFERNVAKGPEFGAYTHKYFIRGQPSLCGYMTRQKIKNATTSSSSSTTSSSSSSEDGRRNSLPAVIGISEDSGQTHGKRRSSCISAINVAKTRVSSGGGAADAADASAVLTNEVSESSTSSSPVLSSEKPPSYCNPLSTLADLALLAEGNVSMERQDQDDDKMNELSPSPRKDSKDKPSVVSPSKLSVAAEGIEKIKSDTITGEEPPSDETLAATRVVPRRLSSVTKKCDSQQRQKRRASNSSSKDSDAVVLSPPKRPLNAYNIFFAHQQNRLLAGEKIDKQPNSEEFIRSIEAILSSENTRTLASEQGENSIVDDLSKKILPLWKSLDPVYKAILDCYALKEMRRYETAVKLWRESKAQGLSNLKGASSASSPSSSTTAGIDGPLATSTIRQSIPRPSLLLGGLLDYPSADIRNGDIVRALRQSYPNVDMYKTTGHELNQLPSNRQESAALETLISKGNLTTGLAQTLAASAQPYLSGVPSPTSASIPSMTSLAAANVKNELNDQLTMSALKSALVLQQEQSNLSSRIQPQADFVSTAISSAVEQYLLQKEKDLMLRTRLGEEAAAAAAMNTGTYSNTFDSTMKTDSEGSTPTSVVEVFFGASTPRATTTSAHEGYQTVKETTTKTLNKPGACNEAKKNSSSIASEDCTSSRSNGMLPFKKRRGGAASLENVTSDETIPPASKKAKTSHGSFKRGSDCPPELGSASGSDGRRGSLTAICTRLLEKGAMNVTSMMLPQSGSVTVPRNPAIREDTRRRASLKVEKVNTCRQAVERRMSLPTKYAPDNDVERSSTRPILDFLRGGVAADNRRSLSQGSKSFMAPERPISDFLRGSKPVQSDSRLLSAVSEDKYRLYGTSTAMGDYSASSTTAGLSGASSARLVSTAERNNNGAERKASVANFWVKPTGKLKPPLSNYDIFCQIERKRILSGSCEQSSTDKFIQRIEELLKSPERETNLQINRELRSEISRNWEKIDPDRKALLDCYAAKELARYRSELRLWETTGGVDQSDRCSRQLQEIRDSSERSNLVERPKSLREDATGRDCDMLVAEKVTPKLPFSMPLGLKNEKQSLPFPFALHNVLSVAEMEGKSSIISWLPHGKAFRVNCKEQFVATMMTLYFKQTKFKSFQRQLNLWGFTRLTEGPDSGAYFHKYFLKSDPALCKMMTRQKIKSAAPGGASSPKKATATKTEPSDSATDAISIEDGDYPSMLAECASGESKDEEQDDQCGSKRKLPVHDPQRSTRVAPTVESRERAIILSKLALEVVGE